MDHQIVISKEHSELITRINECAAAEDWAHCRTHLLEYCEAFGIVGAHYFTPSNFDQAATFFELFQKSGLDQEPADSPANIMFNRTLDFLAKHSPEEMKPSFYVGLRGQFPALFENSAWLTPHGEPCFTLGDLLDKFHFTLKDIALVLDDFNEPCSGGDGLDEVLCEEEGV